MTEVAIKSNSLRLENLFIKVKNRISTTSTSNGSSTNSTSNDDSSRPSSSVSTETKLRLYALYKYCSVGHCPIGGCQSWNPAEIAKHRAWQNLDVRDKQQAMLEYVTTAAELDAMCRRWFTEYQQQQQQNTGEAGKNNVEESHNDCDEIISQSNEKTLLHHEDVGTTSQSRVDSITSNNNFLSWLVTFLTTTIPDTFITFCLPNIQPVIPRGALDIQWSDLWFVVCACVNNTLRYGPRRRQQEDEMSTQICNSWKEQLDDENTKKSMCTTDVVVGYTVRSLLDLYLMHKQFPPQAGKEVIVVPPINIPGMIQILEHHGLIVVPVDTVEPVAAAVVSVDVDVIQAAVTDRTVAILVVHPFGTTSASSEDFARLRRLADKNSLEVWEDAAESYRGIPESTGSPYANLTLLSFGLIKTATALGGGIAIVREQSTISSTTCAVTAATMRRLQQHHFQQQTTREYFCGKVLQAILIHIFSLHPVLYGWMVYFCLQWGGYDFFDQIITRNVRSVVPHTPSRNSSTKSKPQASSVATLTRKRPCLPLLQLLHRRLLQTSVTSRTVERRIQQCQAMTKILQEYAPSVEFLSKPIHGSSYWLYPIQIDHEKKQYVQRILLQDGWDVASGASQLRCVLPTDTSRALPLNSRTFMSNIIYLPVASRSLTNHQCIQLSRRLQSALTSKASDDVSLMKKQRRSNFSSTTVAVALLSLVFLIFRGGAYSASIRWLMKTVLRGAAIGFFRGFIAFFCLGCGLQWLCGSMYLKSTTTFAKYNSMVSQYSKSQEEPPQIRAINSNKGVIKSLPALSLPEARASEGFAQQYVILTGATGFCGSLLLRDLLYYRKEVNLSAGVYIICRGKRSKSAAERVSELLQDNMFSFLSLSERKQLVHVLDGDVTKPYAGLSDYDLDHLRSLSRQNVVLSSVIHAAAAVRFTQELEDAAKTNIVAALNMQELTGYLGNFQKKNISTSSYPEPKFVHISTAFVHGAKTGTKEEPLPEQLFPLSPFQPEKIFESMRGTQFYATKAMSDLRFHNTYAFTKCVCEHLLVQRSQSNNLGVPTLIIRPSIVGPAVENPHEGWAGQKPSTIVAAGCLYLSYQWNLWCFGAYHVPSIPVDVLSQFILAKCFSSDNDLETTGIESAESTFADDSYEKIPSTESVETLSSCSSPSQVTFVPNDDGARIYTASWNTFSVTSAMFTWLDYCGATLHFGSVFGYFYRSTAYVGLWVTSRLLPRCQLSFESYERLHRTIVQWPMQAFIWFCGLIRWNKLEHTLLKLSAFLDLPLLFFPYMNDAFYFDSELSAPATMDGQRYVFSCIVASHNFVQALKARSAILNKKCTFPQQPELFVIGGKVQKRTISLWEALVQPSGSLMVRLVGWLFAKILKNTCYALSVDLSSFELAVKDRQEYALQETSPVHLVLAPTHRSFYDFIILSYLAFAVPELHIDLPAIAAADEFAKLPIIGWAAQCLGAFYLRRGRGIADPELQARVDLIEQQGASVFEVFIEGLRSRDRRFMKPKTGFLRTLNASKGRHLVLPIAISYERLPEQDFLVAEAIGFNGRTELSVRGLSCWLMDACRGKVSLGRIHIMAGEPIRLEKEPSVDYDKLAKRIQIQQQNMTMCSDYHYAAAGRLLGLDLQTAKAAMNRLGCRQWPDVGLCTNDSVALPINHSELFTIMLQAAPQLAKLCHASQPDWAKWLDHFSQVENENMVCEEESAIVVFSRPLIFMLNAAKIQIESAHDKLVSIGFHQPTARHLWQTASAEICSEVLVPDILLAAAAFLLESKNIGCHDAQDKSDVFRPSVPPQQYLVGSEERLGFWGFLDSGFTLQVSKKGSYYVTMRGSRYSLSGKPLSKLLPFIEGETNVNIDPFREAFVSTSPVAAESQFVSSFSEEAVNLLRSAVETMSLSVADRIRHGTGHSQEDIFAIRSSMECSFRIPDAVVWPTSEVEVSGLISLASHHSWCLIPFGGGTNVSNATRCPSKEVEPRPILSVDMTKMKRLLWLNEEDGLACLEAGINGRELVDALHQRGYTMGHEPDSYEFSTLGGWIATKASGMKRNKYGNIEDIVRDIRVVCAGGLVTEKKVSNYAVGRESCGMNFRSLIMGSEGCLGIVTSAVVKVHPLPETREFDSVVFSSFEHGLSFARDVARLGSMIPTSVRLLDNAHFRLGQALRPDPLTMRDTAMRILQKFIASFLTSTIDSASVACATICYEGNKLEVQQQKRALYELSKRHGGISLGSRVGQSGYGLTFMIAYLRDFAMTYGLLGESFETFAPWSKVENIINNTKKKIEDEHRARCLPGNPFVGCRVTQLYHDGACLYFYLCMSTENVNDASKVFSEIEHVARAEIIKQGGSLSHHHGIGKVRAKLLRRTTTPAFQEIVSGVKTSLDPTNIFGAGNGLFSK